MHVSYPQHTPANECLVFQHILLKSLGEAVCYIVMHRAVKEPDTSILDLLSDPMVAYIDVLGSLVESWILSYL